MKETTTYYLLIVLLLMFAACEQSYEEYNTSINENEWLDNSAGNSLLQHNTNSNNENKSLSIKGTFEITSAPKPYPGIEINLAIKGTGTISHLGKTVLTMQKTVLVDQWANPPIWDANASFIIRSSRGDELHGHYETSEVDLSQTPIFIFKAKSTIDGGTGKFEHANGTISFTETVNWDTGVGKLQLLGEIQMSKAVP